MHKGEYLTGDFQTFTVYENGKVVAKRKTRKLKKSKKSKK